MDLKWAFKAWKLTWHRSIYSFSKKKKFKAFVKCHLTFEKKWNDFYFWKMANIEVKNEPWKKMILNNGVLVSWSHFQIFIASFSGNLQQHLTPSCKMLGYFKTFFWLNKWNKVLNGPLLVIPIALAFLGHFKISW